MILCRRRSRVLRVAVGLASDAMGEFLDHFSKADLLASKPAAVTSRGSPSQVSELNIARWMWIRLPVEKTGRLRLQRCRGRGVATDCGIVPVWGAF